MLQNGVSVCDVKACGFTHNHLLLHCIAVHCIALPCMPGRFTVRIPHDYDCELQTICQPNVRKKQHFKTHIGMQGYNAAIIAYGQTGTGKTFTMEGAHSGPSRGIIPRAIEDVFMYIENDRNAAQSKFLVRASYLQIYNEVRDRCSNGCFICLSVSVPMLHSCVSAFIDMYG